jgi:hypothetical protein
MHSKGKGIFESISTFRKVTSCRLEGVASCEGLFQGYQRAEVKYLSATLRLALETVCGFWKPRHWVPEHFTAGNWFTSQIDPRVICGAQSGTGTGLSPVLLFPPHNIIPPMLPTHLHLNTVLTRKTTVQNSETFNKAIFFSVYGIFGHKNGWTLQQV